MHDRSLVLSSLAALFGLCAGCASAPVPPNPTPDLNHYQVTIAANGQQDDDYMDVSVGSSQNVLLTFAGGILPEIRGTLAGSTQLTIPRQSVHIEHAVGEADGVGEGSGTFSSDGTMVDFILHVTTAGYGPSDGGGGLGAMGVVDYHVTGTKD